MAKLRSEDNSATRLNRDLSYWGGHDKSSFRALTMLCCL